VNERRNPTLCADNRFFSSSFHLGGNCHPSLQAFSPPHCLPHTMPWTERTICDSVSEQYPPPLLCIARRRICSSASFAVPLIEPLSPNLARL
jgi:hypothetical protein